MNSSFATYATGVAFRIDLSARMVRALMSLAQGKALDTYHYGAAGLFSRGLVEVKPGQCGSMQQDLQLTEEGKLVVRLCECAGLGYAAPTETIQEVAA